MTAAVDATAMAGEDGWGTAVVPIESLPHAQAGFLGLGAEVEPESLRSRLANAAAGMARLYAAPGPEVSVSPQAPSSPARNKPLDAG